MLTRSDRPPSTGVDTRQVPIVDLAGAAVPTVSIETGSPVEVRCRFDRAWARGFEVAERDATGYRVRRMSDGSVLPVRFPAADVRVTSPIVPSDI
ncbi:MAG: hypothetical protein R2698_10140 [Microthrixaceae bacterium]